MKKIVFLLFASASAHVLTMNLPLYSKLPEHYAIVQVVGKPGSWADPKNARIGDTRTVRIPCSEHESYTITGEIVAIGHNRTYEREDDEC